MFWKSLEGNNQIFLPVNWFFSMKWLNSKSEYYDSDLRLPQHILWKCPCFTNPGSWHLKVMIWDTPPAPILECLTFKTENLIQLYIIRKCLFCYCATWIMWWRVFMFVCFLLVFFFGALWVHSSGIFTFYVRVRQLKFMFHISQTWSCKLFSGDNGVSASILDLSFFWEFWG